MNDGDQPVPQDITSEAVVLGSMIIEPVTVATVETILRRQDFFRPAHQQIYNVLLDMAHGDTPVDLVSVRNTLLTRGLLEQVGGQDYLVSLVEGVPSATNAEHYARMVRDAARRREALLLAERLSRAAYGHGQFDETIAPLLGEVVALSCDQEQQRGALLRDAVELEVEHVEAVSQGRKNPGLMTGTDLDGILRGFGRGELIILAGDTGVGKTTVMDGLCERFAETGAKGVIVSGEMTKREIAKRYIQSMSAVPGATLRAGSVSQQDWSEITAAQGRLQDWKIWIADRQMTPRQIEAIARWRATAWGGLDFLAVDYLQLMGSDRGSTDTERISAITGDLKNIAMRLDIPVIALAQFNREQADVKHPPRLHSLKGSSAIEQTANIALLLWADPADCEGWHGSQKCLKIKLAVAKHRDGCKILFGSHRKLHLLIHQPTTRLVNCIVEGL